MSKRERKRLEVMSQVKMGLMTLAKGSELLELSYRQAKRLRARYEAEGDGGLVHRLRGRPGAGPYTVSGGGSVTGAIIANDPVVTAAINYVNINLSQTLGGEAGTNLTLTSTQTILASSGILDGDGNRVFDTTSVNLSNATTLTISGAASDFVVINVTDNNPAFNGKIVLSGGILSDHVLFNMFGGNYTTHTGGPTLTISTNGQVTTGIFLDPNGGMQINHSVLNGRFWGGDVANQQIVSGADITAAVVPEPSSIALAALGLLCLCAWRRLAS